MAFTSLKTRVLAKKFKKLLESHDHDGLKYLLATTTACSLVNEPFDGVHLPLHYAASHSLCEIARTLLDAGADANMCWNGETPLLLAMHSHEMVQLLADAGANMDATDHDGCTALHNAARSDYADLVQILLAAGANVDSRDNDDRMPLHAAVAHRHSDVVRLLLEAGADINAVDKSGRTALHLATSLGYFDFTELLVEAGADVKLRDTDGMSAIELLLSNPSRSRKPTIIRKISTLLMDAGASVDHTIVTFSPYVPSDVIRAIVPEDTHFWLAANNDAPMLAAELASSLDPNMKTENGMTLLHWACAGDAPECVQLLLDAGADKEAGDPTPIFYCMHESSSCLKCLIVAGMNVNQRHSHCYPIDVTLAVNSPMCAKALVEAGAWLTRKEMIFYNRGNYLSPIQTALAMNPVPVDALRALVAAASERVLGETVGYRSLLDWAVENSTVDGMRVLVESGANVGEKYSQYETAEECAQSVCLFASNVNSRTISNAKYLRSLHISVSDPVYV